MLICSLLLVLHLMILYLLLSRSLYIRKLLDKLTNEINHAALADGHKYWNDALREKLFSIDATEFLLTFLYDLGSYLSLALNILK